MPRKNVFPFMCAPSRLQVECERVKKASKDEPQFVNEYVTSGDLRWEPHGEQESVFGDKKPAATNKVRTSSPFWCTMGPDERIYARPALV